MTLVTPPVIAAGSLARTPQPVLRSGEPGEPGDLVLRPWVSADLTDFVAAYQDPAICRWHTNRPASLDEARAWFAAYAEDWAGERGGHWAVTRNDAVVGRIAVRGFNFAAGLAGCAYWVVPAARGRGVAPAALRTVSEWAFDVGFHRLHLDHSTRNPASCRVATKAGFRPEGIERGAAVHEDGRHDMHLHARVRGDD
ncbi:GNAT family N-acetyltransferase [Actinoplanes sp. NPDC049265]|uniref:GNAT family N-acetyltransferase n=1 Tax=Actinoplanes sp. NPDC049265 TaxID=3363902 RepID=UPI0037191B73